jgi:TRAP-type C4-dicarboxylate transport system substrate-binding protein
MIVMLILVAGMVSAQQIKVASGAPEASPWGEALNRLAADWTQISNGRVRLQVFHNGIAGTETDVLRKMRIGQIHAAVITSGALSNLAEELLTISMPMLIRTEEELDYVFERIRPEIEDAVRENRFEVLGWSKAGWVRFFAADPVPSPDALKDLKLASSPDNEELLQAFRLMGYQVIPVTETELLTALNSGRVEAFYTSPIAAAGFQWFARAPHMLEMRVAPFLGSFVINENVWRRVPHNLKPELIAAAERQIARLDSRVRDLEEEAIETMEQYGLEITRLSDSQEREWFNEFDDSLEVTVGTVFDEELYNSIRRYLSEYRR